MKPIIDVFLLKFYYLKFKRTCTATLLLLGPLLILLQYHSFIWKRQFLDTCQHHTAILLSTQLLAIEMNTKLVFLSQIIHLVQNCKHLEKIVTFLYNFGIHWFFLPKFHILVAKTCIDLRLFSKFPKWPNLVYLWPKFIKLGKNSFICKRPKQWFVVSSWPWYLVHPLRHPTF